MAKYKMTVSLSLVGCKREWEYDTDCGWTAEEWAELAEQEKEKALQDVFDNEVWNHIEGDWTLKE